MPRASSARCRKMVNYWVRDDVRDVIFKHSANLLLNIANEAGDDRSPRSSG